MKFFGFLCDSSWIFLEISVNYMDFSMIFFYFLIFLNLLRATFQDTPFLLSSATLDTASLERITASLDIAGQGVRVLTTSCDRPNIYQQSRVLKRRVDIWLVFSIINFLFEAIFQEHRQSVEFRLSSSG